MEDPDFNLFLLLQKVRRVWMKAREKELKAYGITPEQAGYLYCIAGFGETTVLDISKHDVRDPHTISAVLDRMEDKGLISRLQERGKKRKSATLALTDKGKQAYLQSNKRETVREVISVLTEEQRAQLRLYLQLLLDAAINTLRRHSIPSYLKSQ